jgi:NAD(P)-dependent dehydrogenase (short-subunit alcohol dehydrogenase family)
MTNTLIFGASRGLGALFAYELPQRGDTVWIVSRSQPDTPVDDGITRIWIEADLSVSSAGKVIAAAVGDTVLDVCLYNAGIWEEQAFSESYRYDDVSDEETERLIAVNLTSAITSVQKLLPALRRSQNGKIIFIGSNAGLENSRRPEVAYAASKFGLRGMAHALREVVRTDRIGVTCINLGDVGVVTTINGRPALDPNGFQGIPLADIVSVLRCLITLSNGSCVKEIDLLSMNESL